MIRYLFATPSIASHANSEPVAAVLGRGHGFSSDYRTARPTMGLRVAEFVALCVRQQILELSILGQWLKVRDDRSGRYECSDSISVPRED